MPDRTRILIVDDLPDKRLALSTLLEDLGEVALAASGLEALRQVLDHEFAVILLDVNMPEMDGYETASLIRGRPRSAHTPIIFVTAYADEMHLARGYELGAVDYLLTPINSEILRTKVRVFVELFRMAQQVRLQAARQVELIKEQSARAAAERAGRRSEFLARASRALTESLDYDATLQGLLRVTSPALADLSGVTLVEGAESGWRSEVAWWEAAGLRFLRVGAGTGPADAVRVAIDQALATGCRQSLSGVSIPYPPGGPEAGRLHAAVIVPLLAHGRTIGALTLALADPARDFTPDDLALAEDLAGSAAIAIDNARLYRDIQEADRRKNEFLSMLAHELRNPLAPIMNGIRILRMNDAGRPDLTKVQEMMERQASHLVRMVDDLLDISRITQGKIRLQLERVELAEIVARALEVSHSLLAARKQQLSVTLPEESVAVYADPVRIAQALSNLLNNAAKYTPEGGRIWLTAGQEGEQAALRVRDTGIGIPESMLSSVFDLFTQVDRNLERSQGGLGIGLTLVRRLVELHGGVVEALSEGEGHGSEFCIRLPLAAEARGEGEPRLPLSRPAALVRRVLVADDNADAADSLAMLLHTLGHEVMVARDGQEAAELAAAHGPDVVLLDIGMPRLNGYDAARRIRAESNGSRPTLIAVTGWGQEEDKRRAAEAGFDGHMTKPADLGALKRLLDAAPTLSRAEH